MLLRTTMLSNYNQAIANGAFVSTDTISLLIAVKEENFNKALKHFNNQDILLVSIAQVFSKLHQYELHLKLSNTLNVKTRAFKRDRTFENALSMFLGEEINSTTVRQLHDLVENRLLSFGSKLI